MLTLTIHDPAGTVLRITTGQGEELLPPPPGVEMTATWLLDEIAHPDLAAALLADPMRFRVQGDTVRRDDGSLSAPLVSPTPTVDPAAIGLALSQLPDDTPLTKADLAPLLALFGAGAGQA